MVKALTSRPMRERETTPRFSASEIKRMEELVEEGKEDLSDERFHQKLTEEFNCSPNRTGNRAIQLKQVQGWFERRKHQQINAAISPASSDELVHVSDTDANICNNGLESSSDMSNMKDIDGKDVELEKLEFEAKSLRDGAWYDVGTFLAHRILSSGEPEVRVRYHGFGAEEDEWVNVKKHVRVRSIPLESSECQKVEVGDLVLCFQERSEQAMYFDAHVQEIERKLHDIRGCRCLFLIKYDHDDTKETVNLKRLCRRP